MQGTTTCERQSNDRARGDAMAEQRSHVRWTRHALPKAVALGIGAISLIAILVAGGGHTPVTADGVSSSVSQISGGSGGQGGVQPTRQPTQTPGGHPTHPPHPTP
jgi:hypothetical protein